MDVNFYDTKIAKQRKEVQLLINASRALQSISKKGIKYFKNKMKIVAGYFSKNNTAFYYRVEQGEFSKVKILKMSKKHVKIPKKKEEKKATEEQYYHDLKNH